MSTEQTKETNLRLAREAAFECMMQYGVNLTTHEMVAKKAGLGLRTIRRYFSTKADLVCDVMKTVGSERYQELCSYVVGAVSMESTGLEQLRQLHYCMFDLCKSKRSPLLLISELELFGYENRLPAENLSLYLKTVQDSRKYTKQMLMKGIKDGSIRADIDPEAYTTLLTNTYVGMLQRMEAIRYTTTDYDLAPFGAQVDLHVNAVVEYLQHSTI